MRRHVNESLLVNHQNSIILKEVSDNHLFFDNVNAIFDNVSTQDNSTIKYCCEMFDYAFHKRIIYSGIVFFNIVGLFGNINIVAIHIRKASLRTKYGNLLCLLSFCQSFCLVYELFDMIYGLSGASITRSSCFHFIFPYVFLHCQQTGILMTISIDLFVSIVMPIWHRVSHPYAYLIVLMIPTILYGALIVIFGFIYLDSSPLPLCNPPASLSPSVNYWWYFIMMTSGGITIFCYVVAYGIFALKSHKKGQSQSSDVEHKAMKSLRVLLLVFIFTRFIGTVVANIFNIVKADPEVIKLYQDYNVFFAMLCYSQNYYVCFWRSSEYRRILWEQQAILHKKICCAFCQFDEKKNPFEKSTIIRVEPSTKTTRS